MQHLAKGFLILTIARFADREAMSPSQKDHRVASPLLHCEYGRKTRFAPCRVTPYLRPSSYPSNLPL
ncbi:hypothetical protein SCLCIDRAFT_305816 [Scleroderma citrinum Foug A]|uniref:Uncharacterized protein n=1 Tax=Scleroderma citrinum Foug A TaxID=1036808 RepID=A0A0C2Z0L4_9AGAM|nr:hypothetical protein SCLCIDRAFT_305816 [Scleroderma citrinum Foug A]